MEFRNLLLVVMEGAMADLALVLPFAAVIIVNIFVRRTAKRADDSFGNGSAVTTIDRFYDLVVALVVVFDKESVILFYGFKDNGKLVYLKLLILRRTRVVKDFLLKGNIFANKIAEKRNNLQKVLIILYQI